MRAGLPGKLLCAFSVAGAVSACGHEPVLKGFEQPKEIQASVLKDMLNSPVVESHCRNMIQDVFLSGGVRYQFENSRAYAVVSTEGVTVVSPDNTTCKITAPADNPNAISINCEKKTP